MPAPKLGAFWRPNEPELGPPPKPGAAFWRLLPWLLPREELAAADCDAADPEAAAGPPKLGCGRCAEAAEPAPPKGTDEPNPNGTFLACCYWAAAAPPVGGLLPEPQSTFGTNIEEAAAAPWAACALAGLPVLEGLSWAPRAAAACPPKWYWYELCIFRCCVVSVRLSASSLCSKVYLLIEGSILINYN